MSAAAAVLRQIVVIGSDPAVVCFRLFPGFFGQPPGFGRRRGVFDQTGIAADFFRRMARRFQPVGFRLLVRRTEKFSVFNGGGVSCGISRKLKKRETAPRRAAVVQMILTVLVILAPGGIAYFADNA